MKIKVGIVGYGNLGKAVENILLSGQNFTLVACFSRRITTSKHNTRIEPYNKILEYKNKIDLLFLCGSSKSDIEIQATELSAHFNTINSFDNHKKILCLKQKLNTISKVNNKVSVLACGWDPGLFSIIRILFFSFTNEKPLTFWGKGISMGHSDAIRQITGVKDAVQFTIPIDQSVVKAKQGMFDDQPSHIRECYVVADKNHSQIEKKIKNIPHYFKGEPTRIHFIDNNKLLSLKQKLSHKGQIYSAKNKFGKLEFKISMKSNPMFTAKIMTTYAIAVMNLSTKKQYGSYTCLDIPLIELFENSKHDKVIQKFC